MYNVSALKSVRYKHEYFDEVFFMYAEDLDLGFRLLHKGYIPEFTNKSIIYHKRSSSSGLDSNFARHYHSRNILLTIYKNFPLLLLMKYIVPIIMIQFGMVLLYIKRKEFHILLKSYFKFFLYIHTIYKKRQYVINLLCVLLLNI